MLDEIESTDDEFDDINDYVEMDEDELFSKN